MTTESNQPRKITVEFQNPDEIALVILGLRSLAAEYRRLAERGADPVKARGYRKAMLRAMLMVEQLKSKFTVEDIARLERL